MSKIPHFDTSKLDKPGLVLLGERQEEFLKQWVDDWRGHTMKVLLSQTVFAGVATHHGGYNGYLKADLDSGGWPQTARNNAIHIIRKGMPLHINGDQHLTSLVQYGVDEQRDSSWSFCTPAIAAGYPRWWRPDEVGMPHENRPQARTAKHRRVPRRIRQQDLRLCGRQSRSRHEKESLRQGPPEGQRLRFGDDRHRSQDLQLSNRSDS